MENCKKVSKLFWGGLTYHPVAFLSFLLHIPIPTKQYPLNKMSHNEVITAISQGKSFIRFGDGEVMLLTGRDIYFQKTNRQLAKKLSSILKNYTPTCPYIIGIPSSIITVPYKTLTKKERRVWRLYRSVFPFFFKQDVPYAPLTFFYLKDRFKKEIAPLLINCHVICVSNTQVLSTELKTYMDDTFSSTTYVITPAQNADSQEDSIRTEIDQACSKNNNLPVTILFAAGPASKVLAYEYMKKGIQCLDLGHGMEVITSSKDRNSKML